MVTPENERLLALVKPCANVDRSSFQRICPVIDREVAIGIACAHMTHGHLVRAEIPGFSFN